MSKTVTLDLDDDLAEEWKRNAELHGKSLEQELKDALIKITPPTAAERAALIKWFHSQARYPQQTDSVELLREDRDQR